MKLAEALAQRADLRVRISELTKRLNSVATVQEGDEPPEDPQELRQQLREALQTLRHLMIVINRTNARITLADGRTVMEGLALRDVQRMELSILRGLASEATPGGRLAWRTGRSEIRTVPTLDARALHKEIDALQRDQRLLDVAIQQADWANEVIEG